MILVAMGQDDATDIVVVSEEKGEVRDDDVDAENLLFGKHQPGVDDDQIAAAAEHGAVEAEFAEAAERDDLQ